MRKVTIYFERTDDSLFWYFCVIPTINLAWDKHNKGEGSISLIWMVWHLDLEFWFN